MQWCLFYVLTVNLGSLSDIIIPHNMKSSPIGVCFYAHQLYDLICVLFIMGLYVHETIKLWSLLCMQTHTIFVGSVYVVHTYLGWVLATLDWVYIGNDQIAFMMIIRLATLWCTAELGGAPVR